MKKFYLLTLAVLSFACLLPAQNPSRTTIKGIVRDTSGEEIALPTVMLLRPEDSTLINFTRGDEKGFFQFKNVKNAPYLLKITYVGYLPLQRYLPASASEVNDLGIIPIKILSKELFEVVIKEARSTLSIRGDTVEYDASSFKVPPGSSVEDLLRRLPGIEVDADGNIKAQGRDVKRVYVDGKTFFGDDPKAATKNLGAETISKVQVYNEQSEQSKLTGVDDGKKEKAMNLALKEEYKKGSFGKVTAGVGTLDRWAGRGNYNRFNPKMQLSFIGYANNINQTGVNWDDYREFQGQNWFNDFDSGDFGFSQGGRRFFYFGDDDSPVNNYDGRGLTENYGGGSNFNFDNQKTKLNANYFYNQTALDLAQTSDRESFLADSSFFNSDTTNNLDFRGSHAIATRLEHKIDSLNLLIVKANARLGISDNDHALAQGFSTSEGILNNYLRTDEHTELNTWRLSSAAIFRHRFKKKGRSIAWSGAYNGNRSDGSENLFSLNQFFRAGSFTEQVRLLNGNDRSTAQLKSSALFTEAFSKKWYWETFFNFSKTDNQVDRQAGDPENNNRRVDSLSVFYDNGILYNRLGSSIRYSNAGVNASLGVAGQSIEIRGEASVAEGAPLLADPLRRRFQNLVPNVQVSYETRNNAWMNLEYSYNVSEPQLNDLQPVPNVNNRAFRVEGNSALTPEKSHVFSLNFNRWNPATQGSLGMGANFSLFDSRIVYNQEVELVNGSPVTTTRPDNVAGGNGFNLYSWMYFPVIKTKLTANLNPSVEINNTPAFVNSVRNDTRNVGARLYAGFNLTPLQRLIVSGGGNINFNDIRYSIQAEQNQKIRNYGANVSVKWQFLAKTFLESSFNYNAYRNDRYDFNRDIPILNASVRQLIGKNNRLELRLAAFDVFNRRLTINQFGTQNYVTRSISNTLARYFMLSASYNMKGYENKLSKNEWW